MYNKMRRISGNDWIPPTTLPNKPWRSCTIDKWARRGYATLCVACYRYSTREKDEQRLDTYVRRTVRFLIDYDWTSKQQNGRFRITVQQLYDDIFGVWNNQIMSEKFDNLKTAFQHFDSTCKQMSDPATNAFIPRKQTKKKKQFDSPDFKYTKSYQRDGLWRYTD